MLQNFRHDIFLSYVCLSTVNNKYIFLKAIRQSNDIKIKFSQPENYPMCEIKFQNWRRKDHIFVSQVLRLLRLSNSFEM